MDRGYPPPTRRSRASHRHCTFFLAPNHHYGRRTVWNKMWRKKDESDKIEARKDINNNSQMSEVRKLALQNGIYSNPIKKNVKK